MIEIVKFSNENKKEESLTPEFLSYGLRMFCYGHSSELIGCSWLQVRFQWLFVNTLAGIFCTQPL